MTQNLILATDRGVMVFEYGAQAYQLAQHAMQDLSITSVIAREGVILAGSRRGVFRSDDLGTTWSAAGEGLATPYVRWLAYNPQISDFELAGTEPAGIYVSRNGGASWRACPEVVELRARFGWYLPYSPQAGCVRGFAHQGSRAYAAVEVGGVLRSEDGGETWSLAPGSPGTPRPASPPDVHPDVHSIYSHPVSPDLVFAATGGGFYRSVDGGASWELRYRCYCRAAWIDPDDADHILLGPADSVDRGGRIEVSRDGGLTWEPASAGSQAPWPRHMVERFNPVGEEMLAVLSNGDLLASSLEESRWRRILGEADRLNAVATMTA